MTVRDLTMTAAQAEMLRSECTITGELEGACQVLCSATRLDDDPWSPGPSVDSDLRLAVHRVEPLPPGRVRRRQTSVSWDMDCYVGLLRKARQQNLHPGICHSHPNSGAPFSRQDDENEAHLRDLLQRRNRNTEQVLTSLLFLGDGRIQARVWRATGAPETVSVRILGNTLTQASKQADNHETTADSAFLQRQALSIGLETVSLLQTLRVAVVGCGGTGSAVAVLLARAGIGRLLLVDPDTVTETNLNRLHGSTRRDADEAQPKVTVLKDHIEQMGLGTQVAVSRTALADAPVARLLRSCDVVFGCTDDHLGRLVLNRLAYFYYIPVIDTGLSVVPRTGNRTAHVSGRVTVLVQASAPACCAAASSIRSAHANKVSATAALTSSRAKSRRATSPTVTSLPPSWGPSPPKPLPRQSMNSSRESPASGATRDGLRNAPSDTTSTAAAQPAPSPGPAAPFAPTKNSGAWVTWTRYSTLERSSDARDPTPHGAPRPSGLQGPAVPRQFPSPPPTRLLPPTFVPSSRVPTLSTTAPC